MEKKGFFAKLAKGLTKTRDSLADALNSVFSGKLDEDFFEELEEALILADVGMTTATGIITKLKAGIKQDKLTDPAQARTLLRRIIAQAMTPDGPFNDQGKTVILVVGVNGVGKTTTVGKLAGLYAKEERKVLLAAADTFRAAAAEQLTIWGQRSDVQVIKHQEGADPAAVVFDAVSAAKARGTDMLIVDTAGRLHNKKNLMQELGKIDRVIEREYPDAAVEKLLVLDATTGQNAITQAQVFAQTVELTGVILTKLDGTAKGGMAIAVKEVLGIPVRFIGVGEALDDLQAFVPEDFAEALF